MLTYPQVGVRYQRAEGTMASIAGCQNITSAGCFKGVASPPEALSTGEDTVVVTIDHHLERSDFQTAPGTILRVMVDGQ